MKTYEQNSDKLAYYEMYCNENAKAGKNYETKIAGLEHRIKRQTEKIKKLEASCRVTEEQVFDKENAIVKKEVAYQRLYKDSTSKIYELTELVKKYQKQLNIDEKSKSKKVISSADANISFSHNGTRKVNAKTPIDTKKTILPPIGKGKAGMSSIEIHKSSSRFKPKLVAYKPKTILDKRMSVDSSEGKNPNENTQPIVLSETSNPIESIKQEANEVQPQPEITKLEVEKEKEKDDTPLPNMVQNTSNEVEDKKVELTKEINIELVKPDEKVQVSVENDIKIENHPNETIEDKIKPIDESEKKESSPIEVMPEKEEQKPDSQAPANDISQNVVELQYD